MKLDIFSIDKFIAANHCPEVTSPIFFQYDGNPTPDGLFSYELFGMSDEERKNIFGYIDLHSYFIHPLVYVIMISRMGSLRDIITGRKYAVLADGKIKYVPETYAGAETGIKFLYDNFEKIRWIDEIEEVEIDSIDKKTRLKFIQSLKKDEFFVTKWLVLPPFYRDQSSTNRSMGDEINNLYKELISKARSLKAGFSFDLFGDETKLRMQEILKELYFTTTAPVSGKHLVNDGGTKVLKGSGKNSLFRKHLLGKTLDWTASCVITSPQNNKANTVSRKPVPFGYSDFPLATTISMFFPFFVSEAALFLQDALNSFASDNATKIKKINTSQFSTDVIEKFLKKFVKATDDRFSPIIFEYYDLDNKKVTMTMDIIEYKTENDAKTGENGITRPFTLTDLLYHLACIITRDKHAYVTRYPIAYFQNIYPCKVKPLSTVETRHVWIQYSKGSGNVYEYDEYPMIPGAGHSYLDSKFCDVMIIGNPYLAQMGGDYDGDMVYIKPVFSKEANAEAERLIWAKTNMLTAKGKLARTLNGIGKECIMGMFELTKDGK